MNVNRLKSAAWYQFQLCSQNGGIGQKKNKKYSHQRILAISNLDPIRYLRKALSADLLS